jgi:hypothetical protein
MEKVYDPTYAHFDNRRKKQQKNVSTFIKGTSQTFLVLPGALLELSQFNWTNLLLF